MLVAGNLDDVSDFESMLIDIFTRYFVGARPEESETPSLLPTN
jgi:hypothetical protein